MDAVNSRARLLPNSLNKLSGFANTFSVCGVMIASRSSATSTR